VEQEAAQKKAFEILATVGPTTAALAVQLASAGGLSLLMVVVTSLALLGLRRGTSDKIDALVERMDELQSIVDSLRFVVNTLELDYSDPNKPEVRRLLFIAETAEQRLQKSENNQEVVERMLRFAPRMVEELDMLIFERLCQQAISNSTLACISYHEIIQEMMTGGFTEEELEESVAVLERSYFISDIHWNPFARALPDISRLTDYGFDDYLAAVYQVDDLVGRTATFLCSLDCSSSTLEQVRAHLNLPELVVLRLLRKLEDDGCVIVSVHFGGATIFTKPMIRRWVRVRQSST